MFIAHDQTIKFVSSFLERNIGLAYFAPKGAM